MFKRILIAINSSPFSLKTAKTGFDLAHALDAEVGLIYVIDRHKESVSIEAGPTREESELLSLKQAQETIDPDDTLYNDSKKLYKFAPKGLPKDEILNTAKEWEADLIVMAKHGKTGLSHLLSGSFTEHVIHHATIPVVVVPCK